MSEEKVIIQFDLDYGDSKKQVSLLTDAIISNNNAIKANRLQQRELRKAEGDNTAEIKKLQKEEFKLKDKLSELNRERKKAVDVTKIQANTLEGLRKQTKALFAQREKLNTSTKAGAKRFAELTAKIKQNNEQIQNADRSAGSYTSSIGNYKTALTGVSPLISKQVGLLEQISTSLKATKAGLKANSSGLGVFKAALIGTGIGALLVALGALITMFKQSEAGQDKLNKILKIGSSIFNNVKDVVADVGEAIYNAITSPKKAWDGFIKFVKNQFISRIEGLVGTFKGLGKVIKGVINLDWSTMTEGAKEAGAAIVQANTGFKPQEIADGFKKAANAAKSFGDEVLEDGKKAAKLADQQAKLRRDERQWNIERVNKEAEVAELKLKARQEDQYSAKERIEFQRQALAGEDDLISKQAEFEKRRLDLLNVEASLAKNTIEFNDEINDQEVKLAEQRVARLNARRAGERILQQLIRQGTAEEKRLAREAEEAKLNTLESFAEKDQEFYEDEVYTQLEENLDKEEQLKADARNREAEAKQQAREEELKAEKAHAEEMAGIRKNLVDFSIKMINLAGRANSVRMDNEEKRINKSYDFRRKQLQKQLDAGLISQQEFDKLTEENEKKKQLALYKIEKERFENEKKMALINIAINTALAVMKVWGQTGLGGILAQFIPIAAGLAEAAIVSSQSPPPAPSFAQGGDVRSYKIGGRSHEAGGVKFTGTDGTVFEAEKDEGIFITKRTATAEALSAINEKYGGRSFFSAPGKYYASGGPIASNGTSNDDIRRIIEQTLKNVQIVTRVEDIQTGLTDYDDTINAGIIE